MNIDELQAKFKYGSRWQHTEQGHTIDGWQTEYTNDITVRGWFALVPDSAYVLGDDDGQYAPDDLTPIPDEPTVADQWGYLNAEGRLFTSTTEANARDAVEERSLARSLARIINGVVCNEDGTPFNRELADLQAGGLRWDYES